MNILTLDETKLKQLTKLCRDYNIFPYMLRQNIQSWAPESIKGLFCDLLQEITGNLFSLKPDQIEEIIDSLDIFDKQCLRLNAEDSSGTEMIEIIAICLVSGYVRSNYINFEEIIDSKIENSVVISEYPELLTSVDKSNLMIVDDRFTIDDLVMHYKKHALHYNQFLRREFSGEPNYDFLYPFWELFRTTGEYNTFRIALDHLHICPKLKFSRVHELDYWFGAHFNQDLLCKPAERALTVHQRIHPSYFDISAKLERTEFYWSHDDGINSLQIEEISHKKRTFQTLYINRYIHSQIDIEKQAIIHLDGAVKVYKPEEYQNRIDSKLPHVEKGPYIKLFRIDGNIDSDAWINLVSMFFKSNEMILEYFDPKLFKEIWQDEIDAFNNNPELKAIVESQF